MKRGEVTLTSKNITHKFGIEITEEPTSIYPFSPVYKVKKDDQDVIIKKTQTPLKAAQNLMCFLNALKEHEINIVTPLASPIEINESIYVMYPFIDGNKYTAKDEEIYQSGMLLGKIHSVSSINEFHLPTYDVFDFTEQEVLRDMQSIRQNIQKTNRTFSVDGMEQKLLEAVKNQATIKDLKLPLVATPYDYKANNIVYTPKPFLIDPDNATWLPRIFDLALVLLLFHNELDTAPDCIFTPKQWKLFLEGYKKYTTITDLEKEVWDAVLQHIFLDEVMWLMAEYEEDWLDHNQYNLYRSLVDILFNSADYKI